MNIYLCIIVAALLLEFFLYSLSKILDLKNLSTKLPNEFNGYYSEDEYLFDAEGNNAWDTNEQALAVLNKEVV